jgi:hypothetical protein
MLILGRIYYLIVASQFKNCVRGHTYIKSILLPGVVTPTSKKHFAYVYIPIYQLEYVNIPKIRFIKVITMEKFEGNL